MACLGANDRAEQNFGGGEAPEKFCEVGGVISPSGHPGAERDSPKAPQIKLFHRVWTGEDAGHEDTAEAPKREKAG